MLDIIHLNSIDVPHKPTIVYIITPWRNDGTRCRDSKCLHVNPNQYLINPHCRYDYRMTLLSLTLHANVALLSSPCQAHRLTWASLPHKWGTDDIDWLRRTMWNIAIKITKCWHLIKRKSAKIFWNIYQPKEGWTKYFELLVHSWSINIHYITCRFGNFGYMFI